MEDSNGQGKQHIRKKICAIRESQGRNEQQQKSAAICNRIISMDFFGAENVKNKKIALYFTHKGEVDLTLLKEFFIRNGATCYYPITHPKKIQMGKYDPVLAQEEQCRPGAMGILEPGCKREEDSSQAQDSSRKDETVNLDDFERMDWVFLPGIAFDLEGNRIGYGKGYYDRYLAQYPRECLPLLVAPAFEFQLYRHVAHEPHDIPVEYIFTENRVISTKSSAVS